VRHGAKRSLVALGALVIGVGGALGCPDDNEGSTRTELDAGAADAACSPDLASDPKHCGACGHDCLGGACEQGTCRPYLLADKQNSPWEIAVDRRAVYWTNYGYADDGGTIGTCPLDGCPKKSATMLVSGVGHPRGIAVRDDVLYFADQGSSTENFANGAIEKCTLPGCTDRTRLARDVSAPRDIALAGDRIYFTSEGDGANTGGVYRTAIAGGTDGGAAPDLVTRQPNAGDIAVTGDSVYWSFTGGPSGIRRCPLEGECAPDGGLAAGAPSGLAVTDRIFWGESSDAGSIRTAAVSASAATDFAAPVQRPFSLLADSTHLYFATGGRAPDDGSNDGQLLRCPLASCPTPEVLAAAQDWPHGMAIDDRAIYWVNFRGGQIYKLAK
jgi:hypothetical protein